MTTAQRIALTPNDGAVVYDLDLDDLYVRAAGVWKPASGSGLKMDYGSGSEQPGTNISFNITFTSAPAVIATYVGSTSQFVLSTYSVTTTGFRYDEYRVTGSGSYTVLPISWIAIGV